MVIISFATKQQEAKALEFLLGRFAFHSFRDGTTHVPDEAIVALARQGLPFIVQGTATYEQTVSALRNAVAAPVQRRSPRSRRAQPAHAKRTA